MDYTVQSQKRPANSFQLCPKFSAECKKNSAENCALLATPKAAAKPKAPAKKCGAVTMKFPPLLSDSLNLKEAAQFYFTFVWPAGKVPAVTRCWNLWLIRLTTIRLEKAH